jgi:sugar lactone lactonase YvrE
VKDRLPTSVAAGFLLPESPRWHDGALWFVDMLRGNVHRFAGGQVEHVLSFGRPSSVGFRPNGDMLVCDASAITLNTVRDGGVVDSLDLSPFGGVNDMAVDRNGNAYIDTAGQRHTSEGLLGPWEPVGRIVLVPAAGPPRVVAEKLLAPNGIAISPDGHTLIVGESMGEGGAPTGTRMLVYDIDDDGSLSNERLFGRLARGTADGMCFDAEGGLWVGTAFGHDVQRWVDGELVDRIPIPDRKWPLACALGGADLRTMFICTAAAPPKGDPAKFTEAWLETVDVDVPGFAW